MGSSSSSSEATFTTTPSYPSSSASSASKVSVASAPKSAQLGHIATSSKGPSVNDATTTRIAKEEHRCSSSNDESIVPITEDTEEEDTEEEAKADMINSVEAGSISDDADPNATLQHGLGLVRWMTAHGEQEVSNRPLSGSNGASDGLQVVQDDGDAQTGVKTHRRIDSKVA